LKTRTVSHARDRREKSSDITELAKLAQQVLMLVQKSMNVSLMSVKKERS
jgi:hypothetical protein